MITLVSRPTWQLFWSSRLSDGPLQSQTPPISPKDCPIGLTESPKTAQEASKTAQEAPTTAPRGDPDGEPERTLRALVLSRSPGGSKRLPGSPEEAPKRPQEATQEPSKRPQHCSPCRGSRVPSDETQEASIRTLTRATEARWRDLPQAAGSPATNLKALRTSIVRAAERPRIVRDLCCCPFDVRWEGLRVFFPASPPPSFAPAHNRKLLASSSCPPAPLTIPPSRHLAAAPRTVALNRGSGLRTARPTEKGVLLRGTGP